METVSPEQGDLSPGHGGRLGPEGETGVTSKLACVEQIQGYYESRKRDAIMIGDLGRALRYDRRLTELERIASDLVGGSGGDQVRLPLKT